MKRTVRVRAAVGALLCAVFMLSAPGCYREVISADGIGADSHYPRRAKSSEPKIDKAIDDLFKEKKN